MDGEWEPPMIDNPDYKGEWKARQIDNPEYKGKWVHPEIDNPEYNADDAKSLGKYTEVCKLGFDLWQVKAGTIFDNVLITDDVAEAKRIGDETWGATKDPEKAMKDEQDEVEKTKAEAEAAEAGAGADEDEDDEDLDDIDDEEDADPTVEEHDEL
jgi:calreticulin